MTYYLLTGLAVWTLWWEGSGRGPRFRARLEDRTYRWITRGEDPR
jgi:hypothetical protein